MSSTPPSSGIQPRRIGAAKISKRAGVKVPYEAILTMADPAGTTTFEIHEMRSVESMVLNCAPVMAPTVCSSCAY